MSSSLSTSRNRLQVTCVQVREGVELCDCNVLAKEQGRYKNLLYSLKQKLDAKEDLSEMNNLRTTIAVVEFLLSQEKCKIQDDICIVVCWLGILRFDVRE
uniref:Uncharacterized protein n=1 Tax=Lactuca sativa TaxID=4236 RepID=A0A9R1UE24_LACSA|nr:hypothetical protein LSAT_V11C900504080 [Lactuca sativa]